MKKKTKNLIKTDNKNSLKSKSLSKTLNKSQLDRKVLSFKVNQKGDKNLRKIKAGQTVDFTNKQVPSELDLFLVDNEPKVVVKGQITYQPEQAKNISNLPTSITIEALNPNHDFDQPDKKDFKPLLPHKEIKIFLNKSGETLAKEATFEQSNSAYLIDLKNSKSRESLDIFLKPSKAEIKSEISENFVPLKKSHFNTSTSFVKKKRLVDVLDELGLDVYRWYAAKFKSKKTVKPTPVQITKVYHDWSEKLLINLKLALNFALIALLLVLPIRGVFIYQSFSKTQGQVMDYSQAAWQQIKQGAMAATQADWRDAALNFNTANSYFSEALSTIETYNSTLLNLIKIVPAAGKKLSSGQDLLNAGKYLSFAAQNLSETFSQTQKSADLNMTVTKNLVMAKDGLNVAKQDLSKAVVYLSQVDPDVLPAEFRDYLKNIQTELPKFQQNLDLTDQLFTLALEILGHDQPKRFLFMFQNTNEIRASGGFFGSLAMADIKEGKIDKLEVPGGGPYDLKGYLTERVISPQPLHLVGTAWEIWDANWWADFPTSAKKVSWFFEKSGWPSVDGIIAFNSSLIPELLKIVGNIEMPEYDKILTPDNVVLALQHATIFEYKKNQKLPKEIIGDLMPIIVERLLSIKSDKTLPLLLTLNDAFRKKDIQLYFNKPEIQQLATNFGLTGEQVKSDKDYLMVVNTNIGGGKTDGVIEQKINQYSYVQEDGSIIDTVAINRMHNGNKDDVFERVNNVDYVRLYVPEGSQLIDVTGFNPPDQKLFKEVYSGYQPDEYLKKIQGDVTIDSKTGTSVNNELSKTVFGNWIQVEPGQSETITFSYRLPFKIGDLKTKPTLNKFIDSFKDSNNSNLLNYSLLVQRQSGASKTQLKSYLFLPDSLKIKWINNTDGSSAVISEKGVNFSTELNTDQYYAVILGE
jgi:hypothetical protein